jgi:hypothetical protein
LQAAAGQHDVLVTVDQNLQFQQNLKNHSIAVIVLSAPRSTYAHLKPLMPLVLNTLPQIKPGDLIVIK